MAAVATPTIATRFNAQSEAAEAAIRARIALYRDLMAAVADGVDVTAEFKAHVGDLADALRKYRPSDADEDALRFAAATLGKPELIVDYGVGYRGFHSHAHAAAVEVATRTLWVVDKYFCESNPHYRERGVGDPPRAELDPEQVSGAYSDGLSRVDAVNEFDVQCAILLPPGGEECRAILNQLLTERSLAARELAASKGSEHEGRLVVVSVNDGLVKLDGKSFVVGVASAEFLQAMLNAKGDRVGARGYYQQPARDFYNKLPPELQGVVGRSKNGYRLNL